MVPIGAADVTSCLNLDFWSVLGWSKCLRANTSGSLGFILRQFHSVDTSEPAVQTLARKGFKVYCAALSVLIRIHTERSIHIHTERSIHIHTERSIHINTERSIHINTERSIYINTERSIHINAERSIYINAERSVYINAERQTAV